MRNKCFVVFLAIIMIFTIGMSSIAFGKSADEMQEELNILNEEKAETESHIEEMVADIEEKQAEVDKIQAELDKKQAEVDKTLSEVNTVKQYIKERQDGLNMRLRTMYKNGSIGFVDVILGSDNLSELLSNAEMLFKIYQNDQDILKQLEKQHEVLERKEKVLLKQKQEIAEKKEVADKENSKLKQKKEALQKKLDNIIEDANKISAEIVNLQSPDIKYSGGKFIWPANTKLITSPFGYRVHPVTGIWTGHTGVDIGCRSDSPVRAAASGKVIISQWYGSYGYAVVIDHGSGLSTLYGHNNQLIVNVGQEVKQGDVIAYSGSTGMSTGPHLHFEVRKNGNYVDPMEYF